MSGYRLNGGKEYYKLPVLGVQGRQPAYILIRYDENGVCGYRTYAGEYSFRDPNAANQTVPDENAPSSSPIGEVPLQNCSETEKVTTLEIDGNVFTLREKEGNLTVEGHWNTFSKCPSCPAKADSALQAALTKARANNGDTLTQQTIVLAPTTIPYGPAGEIVYQGMTLRDLLTNLAKTYNSLVDNAQVPPAAWQPGQDFFVRDGTGVISGAIDQALEEAKDIPELVGLGLSVVSDPQGAKDQLINFAQQMDWQKAQDLAQGIAEQAVQYDNFSKGGQYARYSKKRRSGPI
jgi:hypothetical protein